MIRRYNLSHPVGQPMPEDWIRLPDSVVAAADYDALAQLVCDLWHSSAAAHIPPWLQKRVRDVSHAQLAEAQRFPHGAAAVTGCDMKINDEGRSNAAHWYERAMKAEVRLQKIMARCADLLDEDQFNELDAMMRTTVTVSPAEGEQ